MVVKHWKTLVATGALASVAVLGACSSQPDQSVEQACAVIQEDMDAVFQEADLETFDGLSGSLDEITDKVHNAEVRDAWVQYADAMKGMVALFNETVDVATSEDGTEALEDVDFDDETLQRQEELYIQLEEAGMTLGELCGDMG